MVRCERGGAAAQLLGGCLLLLLLTGGLGLAEISRASLVRTRAALALEAALEGAATAPAARREAVFRQILARNLDGSPHRGELRLLRAGEPDPTSGERLRGPALLGELRMEHRLAYLSRWLPGLELIQRRILPLSERNRPGAGRT